MPKLLSPTAKQQFFTDGSTVAAGYLLYTYAANTTTPEATYSDRAGAVPNANPIVLNARGEATIFLTPGTVYDFVLKTQGGATVWTQEDVETRNGLGNGYATVSETAPTRNGFFVDDDPSTSVHKFRDRVFFGDAVNHTGRRAAPYGGSWMSDNYATWPEKNAQVSVLQSEGRIALLGGSRAAPGYVGGSTIGIAGIADNASTGTVRAGYFDAVHRAGASATYGVEIALTNYGSNVTGNSYSLTGGTIGIHLAPEGSTGYTIGDSDTAVAAPANPGTAAINIGQGSAGGANARWNMGIRFSAGSITGTDGTTGTGVAIAMGLGHALEWRASNAILGATIRSDVTAVASQDTGLLFKNNEVQITGPSEIPILRLIRDTVGTPVNYLRINNGRTGINPLLIADGTDANAGIDARPKGTGAIRLQDSAAAVKIQLNTTGIGFFGAAAAAKPTVTGSRGGNAALASLLTALATLGLITDSSTA